MRLLCVANWSEGRDARLLDAVRKVITGVTNHFDGADYDHNRIVTAFSGDADDVRRIVFRIADELLPNVDLSEHEGVHPRIGVLDVCPFIILDETELAEANAFASDTARTFAERYEVPVYMYERSAGDGEAADLPAIRKGFYGTPDYGPSTANPKSGTTVMGVRDWLIAVNVNLDDPAPTQARAIAEEIRRERTSASALQGVRALGLALPSQQKTQVSMNVTMPNVTDVDPIVEFVRDRATCNLGTELIGVIRPRDLPGATCLRVDPKQVVE